MLWSIDSCQITILADQYHVTISWAQVSSLPRSLVFNWIVGSCQVNLLIRAGLFGRFTLSNVFHCFCFV